MVEEEGEGEVEEVAIAANHNLTTSSKATLEDLPDRNINHLHRKRVNSGPDT